MAVMMRLTKRRANGTARMSCSNCPEYHPNCNGRCMSILEERLAAIEDILGEEYNLDDLRLIMDGALPIKVHGFAGEDTNGRPAV